MQTLRQALGQLVFCEGCCCGRTDRGKPELPVEKLKTAWREGRLNRTVQLTISGCLGPCDLTNVTLLLTQDEQIWLGGLEGEEIYDEIIAWAKASDASGKLLPLPKVLEPKRFTRWAVASEVPS
jgi:hypothetical protein